MAENSPIALKRCDSASVSTVNMDAISALTELEDLERVYQQLCAQEVRLCLHFVWIEDVKPIASVANCPEHPFTAMP